MAAQRGCYSAYLDLGDLAICSASPELFFEMVDADILARPMKGTAKRGRTLDEDRAIGVALAASAKERAENVMVVDMIRNDLGRIADVGTVEVPELFAVERFPAMWQMTSLIKARSLAPLADVFAALHPSASITGAPKVRTMQLLAELEAEPRGVYTGAIGHIPPDGRARFSVAIRTAVVDRREGQVSFGVGSGVVWDSEPDAEYAECLLKGSILGRRAPQFDLLETMLWDPAEGFVLLERHMARLAASAEYFGITLDRERVDAALRNAIAGVTVAQRLRLLVDSLGAVRVEPRPHASWHEPVRVALARGPIDTTDPFLYHKTTQRRVYEDARAAVMGVDHVLLWNENGVVTEATLANVVVELDGRRVTPPVSDGLLPGTFRAELIERGDVVEESVRVDALGRATAIWLVNSVQGWKRAVLVDA
ncbi:MAG: bifunctional chorismate-binding protein/class IV aminotransferase [Vicinamibacterales bacterium]